MTPSDNHQEIKFMIQGMTWMSWESKAISALEGLQGTNKTIVSYPKKEAIVSFDPNQVDFEQMKKALFKIGYFATMQDGIQKIPGVSLIKPFINSDFRRDDLVCYCFGYTRNDIEQDYLDNSQSKIMARIVAEKKAGGCNCAVKNPKGRWCLADVRQVVDKLKNSGSFEIPK